MAQDAAFDVSGQQFHAESVEGRPDRRDLREDIYTVAILIHHSLNPGHLPGNAIQSRLHVASITLLHTAYLWGVYTSYPACTIFVNR